MIVEMFFMLHNGLKISKYEAHWLMDFMLINNWVNAKRNSENPSFF